VIKHIKTGNRVEISFEDTTNPDKRRKLSTLVEAVLMNKNQVSVLMPMAGPAEKKVKVRLPVGSGYELQFFTDLSIYRFDGAVVEHLILNGEHLTILRLNSAGEKVQLRDFFRHNSAIQFRFNLVDDQLGDIDEIEMHQGVTRDLSGGGMSFLSDVLLKDGIEIYANFVLGGEYITLLGKVLGRSEMPSGAYKYQYRTMFLAVPEAEQEKIIKFIHNQQYNKSLR